MSVEHGEKRGIVETNNKQSSNVAGQWSVEAVAGHDDLSRKQEYSLAIVQ